MGVRRERCRILCGLLLATAITLTTIAPVAADTNLVIGGKAVVAKTGGDGVNFRDAVGYSAKIIRTLPEGTSVKVIGGPLTDSADGTTWYNVDVDGKLGWIVSDYLTRPALSEGDTVTVVNTDGTGVRLRESASTSGATLTVIPEGTSVKVVGPNKTDGNGGVWSNVSYNGKTGFASNDYLAAGGSAASTVAVQATVQSGLSVGDNAEIVNTDGDGLNLRSSPGYGSGVITVAKEGAVVHLLDGPKSSGGITWWSVDYRGTKGWVHGGFLAKTDKEPTATASSQANNNVTQARAAAPAQSATGDQIAATAMKYLGTPYAWGGTTPRGFDCSGFTYFVVNQVIGGGFSRDMEAQAASGVYVDPNNLQPGDIVFQQNTYKWGLSHTGIYIGDGKFVNAASEGVGVVVSNLWDSYWGPRYYTARRIVR